MALDQNLMGLGLAAPLAARVANAGTGPVTMVGSGGTIGGKQFVVYVSTGTGTLTVPAVGGSDMAPEIGDDFVIHNALSGNLTVSMAGGASISVSNSNTTSFTLTPRTTMSMWVVTTTQWFGIRN